MPSLDEALTVGEFVEWCHEGLAATGLGGEILIVDSSSDQTPFIALEGGARVLRVPRRGLGRAYLDASRFARGRYLILGDADCTYDFRDLAPFVAALDEGADFVMGSRFKGSIEKGAMPPHHRYLGTPITTFLMNRLFGTRYSDIHCGMRAITAEGFRQMDLQSQGWEYASEMLVAASRLGMKTTEVPIPFYKDRNGRTSHVKRQGWTTPFRAGWHTLRVLFTNAADFFLLRVGVSLAAIGTLALAILALGPVDVGPATFTLHAQVLALSLAVTGWAAVGSGIIARLIYERSKVLRVAWARRLRFTRTMAWVGLLWAVGLTLDVTFAVIYVRDGYSVSPAREVWSHLAVTGLFLLVFGFVLFTTMLVVQAVSRRSVERS